MDISAMDPQGIQQLFDAEVFGPEGESIGTVEQIFADDVTGSPTFVTVKDATTGVETFLPVGGAGYDNKIVTVPFSKDVVDAAPAAGGGDDLSPDRESEVYHYYGVRAPRRTRAGEGEPSPEWGQEADTGSPQPEDAAQPVPEPGDDAEPADDVASVEDAGGPEEGEPEQETVPDDATAQTSLDQDEPQFDPAPEGLDAGSPDEFRSIEEVDEQQDAAAPESDAEQSPVDELPAEETAVIEGGSFPFAATTAGGAAAGAAAGAAVAGAAAGSQQGDEAEDTAADEEGLAGDDQSLEERTPQEQIDDGEDALATPRADGETPAAAREDEAEPDEQPDSEEQQAASDAEGQGADEESTGPAEAGGETPAVAPVAAGLPEGAALRKYTVTEMVTVQVPVTREVVCWQDADGGLHELEPVPAPDKAAEAPKETPKKDAADPANWWFGKSGEGEQKDSSQG